MIEQKPFSNDVVGVIGGTGLLGRALTLELLSLGYNVRLLIRPGSQFSEGNFGFSGKLEYEELIDWSVQEIKKKIKGCFALVHAAGVVGYDKKSEAQMSYVHIELTKRVVEAVLDFPSMKFIYVSSIVTLGYSKNQFELRSEDSSFNASDLNLYYWQTKYDGEKIVRQSSLPHCVIIHPGTILSAYEKYPQFKPMVHQLNKKIIAPLPKGGSCFISASEVARGISLSIKNGVHGTNYILGSENLSYEQIYKKIRRLSSRSAFSFLLPTFILSIVSELLRIAELFNIELKVTSAKLRRVNGVYLFFDLKKAKRELGFVAKPIDSELQAMLES